MYVVNISLYTFIFPNIFNLSYQMQYFEKSWQNFASINTVGNLRGEGSKIDQNCQRIVQVNLCQKLLFLHQFSLNMTTDCSWNYHENYKRRTWAEHVLPMFCSCSALVVFMVIPLKSFVILWVGWCKDKCFWKRFTCTKKLPTWERGVSKIRKYCQHHLWMVP